MTTIGQYKRTNHELWEQNTRLRAETAALRALVAYYENEMNRSSYAADQLPKELLALEQAVDAARKGDGK